MPRRVAIVGAGMAGMTCGDELHRAGCEVRLFDKGRGPGGRMSTRRVTIGDSEVGFDHGAQYFTVRDRSFRGVVKGWQKRGLVAPWPAAGTDAWVGTPAMNAPLAAAAQHLAVRFSTRIDRLERAGAEWRLLGEGIDLGSYDAVVVAVPAEQVPGLIVDYCPGFAVAAKVTPSKPCWTVMAAFAAPVACSTDSLKSDGDIVWAARNSAKPGRSGPESWVIQASPDWSRAHRGAGQAQVTAALLQTFRELIGQDLPPTVFEQAHSWLFARSGSNGYGYLWDRTIGLGVCGDWLIGPRVECAWMSGHALARAVTMQPS